MTKTTKAVGSVVTPAPKSAKGKSTKTTTTPKVTKSAVLAHLATSRTANLGKGVKGYYTDKGAEKLAGAIARASELPTMSSAGVTTGKSRENAKARRDFCRANRATLIDFADILGENKAGEITHDRPENTVRARLFSIARAMGLPQDTFYAVRAEAYAVGETPKAYIVRK